MRAMESTARQLTLRDARPTFAVIVSLLFTAAVLATRSGHYGVGFCAAFLAANFALAVALGQAIRAHATADEF